MYQVLLSLELQLTSLRFRYHQQQFGFLRLFVVVVVVVASEEMVIVRNTCVLSLVVIGTAINQLVRNVYTV